MRPNSSHEAAEEVILHVVTIRVARILNAELSCDGIQLLMTNLTPNELQ